MRDVHTAATQAIDDGTDNTFETADITQHDTVSVSGRQVLNCLNRLVDFGLLGKRADPDDGRRVLWTDSGLSTLEEHEQGVVELPEVDVSPREDEVEWDSEKTLFITYTGFFAETPAPAGGTPGTQDSPPDDDQNDSTDPPP